MSTASVLGNVEYAIQVLKKPLYGSVSTADATQFTTTCVFGTITNVSHACPSSSSVDPSAPFMMSHYCNGTVSGDLISNCPVLTVVPVCNMICCRLEKPLEYLMVDALLSAIVTPTPLAVAQLEML